VSDTAFVEEGVGRDATFREKKKILLFDTLKPDQSKYFRAGVCLSAACEPASVADSSEAAGGF